MTAPDRVAAVVRRLLPAPPSLVYDTWLDAEAFAEFITPQPARSGRIEWAPRVGAPFRIDMVDAEGTVQITGEILELERPSLLRFTWRSSLGGGFDSVVTVTLVPSGEAGTLMTDRARPASRRNSSPTTRPAGPGSPSSWTIDCAAPARPWHRVSGSCPMALTSA